jgi:aspartate aminotransferase
MKQLSQRVQSVSPSRTVQLSGVIDTLRRQGQDIINLGIGEPYEAPSPHIISATADALQKGRNPIRPRLGLPELRHAVARQFEGYEDRNIIITNGSKQALYTALQVLCDPEDQVIIPRPCWVSFCEQIKLAGAEPVMVDTTSHQLDCQAIEAAINLHTKAIIINSPNNPTGAVYPRKDLEKIADLARAHDLYLISDEAYEAFVYDGLIHHSLFDFPHIRDRLIVAGSFSKTHCMTGFRIGFAAAPKRSSPPWRACRAI